MSKREERRSVSFSKWQPTAHARYIGYSYFNPTTGRVVRPGFDRWMRAKAHIAEAALWTGAYEFTVWGGTGTREWQRQITVTQDEAEQFLRDAIAQGAFSLKGTLRRALAHREARLNPDPPKAPTQFNDVVPKEEHGDDQRDRR